MPRKKKNEIDSKIQQKLDYIGLDLMSLPKNLRELTNINFKVLKGYDEKRYKQYRFVNVDEIEILLSPTNRANSIKEKYEKASPLIEYLDNKNEENLLKYTKFLEMLSKVRISEIQEVENEQKSLSKSLPFKLKYEGNYLWQIFYSEVSKKYFMIVTTEDSDYSTFFYLLKKKIENNIQEKVFVPVSCMDYSGDILSKSEIKDVENYLWLFTKDYPSIYEVYNQKKEENIQIIGETKIYENIKTLYKVVLKNPKDASKFYKLVKALFIMQTELPHYFQFDTRINKSGSLEFFFENTQIEYEILPEFVYEQYLKSISLRNKVDLNIEELKSKLNNFQIEEKRLLEIYSQKEKQITTYLECKKTFFGKVKYFFKYSGKTKKDKEEIIQNDIEEVQKQKESKKEKFKLEERNYTLHELEESYKELNKKEEEAKNLVLDINALKLKNKNLKKKIENASNYLEEINKHKKSIFEFWKYANKDAVASLDEGEEEEINIKKIEKVFSLEDDFEKFGAQSDKVQRSKLTDDEMDSIFVADTRILGLINKIYLKVIENKEISEELKRLKIEEQTQEIDDYEEEEIFNIFGKIKDSSNKERTIGNKTHRENPRDLYQILEIQKGTKGIELKRTLEKVLKNILSALSKNILLEDMYVYIVSEEKKEFNSIEKVSLNVEKELDDFLANNKAIDKLYLYKIKIPKETNYIAFTNIIYYDNKNMTLPVGMNLSNSILIDFSKLKFKEKSSKKLNKLKFENEEDDFSKIIIKNIMIEELK